MPTLSRASSEAELEKLILEELTPNYADRQYGEVLPYAGIGCLIMTLCDGSG